MKPAIDTIFEINAEPEFTKLALDIFKYQSSENEVYRKYINTLKIDSGKVANLESIPFLPVELFKSHKIITSDQEQSNAITVFSSSGTAGMEQSKHFVSSLSVYEKSYLKSFELFYGDIKDYCILALLPSYLEREGSSLIYMAADLIKKSCHPDSGFYLNNYEELNVKLTRLLSSGKKVMLLGVTYALLDLAEKFPLQKSYDQLIVMETGGMKGKRKEMIREELHEILCNAFGVKTIHSEYGMTELLSQAYSKGNGIFNCPPWMKIILRDTNDPFSYLPPGKTGGVNVIDLANINSCAFIAAQDLGKLNADGSFEILGRFDNSDIRGCSLLIQ